MAFHRESRQFSVGGDPSGSTCAAAQKPRTSGLDVDNDEMMFSADHESRLFQKGGGVQRCLHGSSIRTTRGRGSEDRDWIADVSNGIPTGDRSDGMEDEDDDERHDLEEDGEDEGRIFQKDGTEGNQNNGSSNLHCRSEKVHQDTTDLLVRHSSFGSRREVLAEDGNGDTHMENFNGQQKKQYRAADYDKPDSLSGTDSDGTQTLQGGDGPDKHQEELGREKEHDSTRGKETSSSLDSGECVRMHLSDPITGALMDDAMILFCGHSYGSAGMQHVIRMKSCFKCQQPVSEEKMLPNLVLRAAVRAFRHEEEFQFSRSAKRKRDRSDVAKRDYGYPFSTDLTRGKGVQFPFAVSDRVIIKGNKRTPDRFIGRIATVTTQCLNGWYVVKTLDNAECIKLQYRSLVKMADDPTSQATNPLQE
ncbi:unnamed protein product [Spirodela intermedia]|uniref:U-box domain-containing protein n=1 Tax=Spirodela intermedia TaxID=51605 RepID=A0A7I8K7K9_SPIIN|nr:unnamed protein product [Spirodela intermedia]